LSGRAIIERMRFFAAIVATAAVAALAVACGGSPGSSVAELGTATATTPNSLTAATSTGSPQVSAALAFSRCMRSHGVPSFPDPDPDGNVASSALRALGVPKQAMLAADQLCKHLLPRGGSAGTDGDQVKLDFALKAARCMRTHGFPTYPDPSGPSPSSQGSGTRFHGTGIDTKSRRFQTTEVACERAARKALGLP
jgi:hypothetical protein